MDTLDSLWHFIQRALQQGTLLKKIAMKIAEPGTPREKTVQSQPLQFAAEEFYD